MLVVHHPDQALHDPEQVFRLGTWIAHQMGLPELLTIQVGGQPFPVVWSIIGAALFAAIMNLARPRRDQQ